MLPKQLIKGFYFGIDNQSNYKEINNNTTSEYLFYKNDNYVNDIQTIIYSFRDLFEKLFASQTPTTIQYGKDEPYYILDKKINIDVNIEKIQEGAVNFIKKFLDIMIIFLLIIHMNI